MKLKDICTQTKNSNNKQISFVIRKLQLRKYGLTPEQVMELSFPKPKVRFYKK